jgi:hypothetical protein
MKKIGIVASSLFVVIVIVALLAMMFSNARRNDRYVDNYITEYEQELITADLRAKSVGDCVLTRTEYGFEAREIRTGKIYKVKTIWGEE